MFARRLSALLLVFLLPLAAFAQNLSLSTVYFGATGMQGDFETVQLDGATPTFGEEVIGWAWGVRVGTPTWRFGIDTRNLAEGADLDAPFDGATGKIAATQVVFDVNYGLIQAGGGRFIVAPTLGAGWERTRLSFRRADVEDVDAEPPLIDFVSPTAQFEQYGLLFDASLQIDYALRFDAEFDEIAWILSVRGGYRFVPATFGWREIVEDLGSTEINGFPEFDFAGPYVSVSIGL
ncbi:MAG: hypothetical protein AAGI08_02645 [Bacteroidota bacterium]